MEIIETFRFLTDSAELIRLGGYLALALIVFTETGLLVGFFLPGDSLLVTAGLFAAAGQLDLGTLLVLLFVSAVAGDATGYLIGRSAGRRLFKRADSRIFRKDHLLRSMVFYQKHGGKTIVIARFVPVVRTFAPVLAGVSRMKPMRFALYNVTGGALWVGSMTLTGYLLGRTIPNIGSSIEIVILFVIALSLLPVAIEAFRSRRRSVARHRAVRDTTRQITGLVSHSNWDWGSPASIQASVAAINSARRAIAILDRNDADASDSARVIPGLSRVELEVESTGASISGAELELARLDMAKIYPVAVHEVHQAIHNAATVCSARARSRCWSLGNAHVAIAVDDSDADRARIVITLEPSRTGVMRCQASQLEALSR